MNALVGNEELINVLNEHARDQHQTKNEWNASHGIRLRPTTLRSGAPPLTAKCKQTRSRRVHCRSLVNFHCGPFDTRPWCLSGPANRHLAGDDKTFHR